MLDMQCLRIRQYAKRSHSVAAAARRPRRAEPTAHQAVVQRRAGDGERKRVTVLFADLEGSTAAIEGLDPEAALGQIEPAVQIMMRLVDRYEGVVCRRLGDGILALFGAPVAHEDHAVRACFAALGIQRELREAGMADRVRVGLELGRGALSDHRVRSRHRNRRGRTGGPCRGAHGADGAGGRGVSHRRNAGA